MSHVQPSSPVIAEQQPQQQGYQQQKQPLHSSNPDACLQLQLVSNQGIASDTERPDEGQAGQGITMLPSGGSPVHDQAAGLQEESDVSPSHVSQSVVSCNSHDSGQAEGLSHEQQNQEEQVIGQLGHMPLEQAAQDHITHQGQFLPQTMQEPDQAVSDETGAHALSPAGAVDRLPAPAGAVPLSSKKQKPGRAQSQKPSQQLPQPKQQVPQPTQQQQQEKLAKSLSDDRQHPNQISRAGSREASAIPAESQQSAVHSLLPAAQIRTAPPQEGRAQGHKHRVQLVAGQAALDDKVPSGRTKKHERVDGGAADQSGAKPRKRGRPRLDAAYPPDDVTTTDSQTGFEGHQADTERIQAQVRTSCRNQHGDEVVSDLPKPEGQHTDDIHIDVHFQECEQAVANATLEAHADDGLTRLGKRHIDTSSNVKGDAGASSTAPAAKRHLRSRDSDAIKPWWVV